VRERRDVFIGVGSNVGPCFNVVVALLKLAHHLGIAGVSTFYWTAPADGGRRPDYLNGVVRASTDRPGRELKYGLLRAVEDELGRVRTADADASRTIDLDLLLCGDEVIRQPGLSVPDPDLYERPFIAHPVAELAPELVIPGSGTRIHDVAARLDPRGMLPDRSFTRSLLGHLSPRAGGPRR
jgi:2-amino-4-hydroxy-6-hydroxymethyldihydropteridine diphosphokinase